MAASAWTASASWFVEISAGVFEEPDEHARQHPRDSDLRDLLIAPGVERFRRALAHPRRLILRLEWGVDLRVSVAPPAQVLFQQRDALLEGGQELFGIYHRRGGDKVTR